MAPLTRSIYKLILSGAGDGKSFAEIASDISTQIGRDYWLVAKSSITSLSDWQELQRHEKEGRRIVRELRDYVREFKDAVKGID